MIEMIEMKDAANGYSSDSVVVTPSPPNHPLTGQQQDNNQAAQPEAMNFRIAIILLATIALVVVLAAIALPLLTKPAMNLSEGALAIGSTAIGGLAGIVIPRVNK